MVKAGNGKSRKATRVGVAALARLSDLGKIQTPIRETQRVQVPIRRSVLLLGFHAGSFLVRAWVARCSTVPTCKKGWILGLHVAIRIPRLRHLRRANGPNMKQSEAMRARNNMFNPTPMMKMKPVNSKLVFQLASLPGVVVCWVPGWQRWL